MLPTIKSVMTNLENEYRHITLPNGDILIIKFDDEGIVYDLWSADLETHLESYGYDFYEERNLSRNN